MTSKSVSSFAVLVLVLGLGSLTAQQGQSPLPALPGDIPQDAVIRMVLADKTPTGQDAVWKTSDGAIHELFQFNDRGRGPKIYTTYHVDPSGLVVAEQSKGVDYMKNDVTEQFSLTAGEATWKNQSEDQKQANAAGKFYIDINGGPEAGAILARALLQPNRGKKLAVLPGGDATIRRLKSLPVEGSGKKTTATLYEIGGLAFTPNYLWLDDQQQFFASISGWFSVVRQGFEPAVASMREIQRQFETAHSAELAKTLTHKPSGELIVSNVALFDSMSGKVVPAQRVTVRGERILSVEPEQSQAAPDSATVIDGKGKMLLPGLWDMHAHVFSENAYLDIATGVTTIRDMGNSIDELTKLRQNIADGKQIGPRVVLAGFIDGPGPYEGPIKVLAATPEEAKQRVDHYKELGYVQEL